MSLEDFLREGAPSKETPSQNTIRGFWEITEISLGMEMLNFVTLFYDISGSICFCTVKRERSIYAEEKKKLKKTGSVISVNDGSGESVRGHGGDRIRG